VGKAGARKREREGGESPLGQTDCVGSEGGFAQRSGGGASIGHEIQKKELWGRKTMQQEDELALGPGGCRPALDGLTLGGYQSHRGGHQKEGKRFPQKKKRPALVQSLTRGAYSDGIETKLGRNEQQENVEKKQKRQ